MIDTITQLGKWKPPTQRVYVCGCGCGVWEVELLQREGQGDGLWLRCWGCKLIHWNMSVIEQEQDENEEE